MLRQRSSEPAHSLIWTFRSLCGCVYALWAVINLSEPQCVVRWAPGSQGTTGHAATQSLIMEVRILQDATPLSGEHQQGYFRLASICCLTGSTVYSWCRKTDAQNWITHTQNKMDWASESQYLVLFARNTGLECQKIQHSNRTSVIYAYFISHCERKLAFVSTLLTKTYYNSKAISCFQQPEEKKPTLCLLLHLACFWNSCFLWSVIERLVLICRSRSCSFTSLFFILLCLFLPQISRSWLKAWAHCTISIAQFTPSSYNYINHTRFAMRLRFGGFAGQSKCPRVPSHTHTDSTLRVRQSPSWNVGAMVLSSARTWSTKGNIGVWATTLRSTLRTHQE